jgi:hypothetical protein
MYLGGAILMFGALTIGFLLPRALPIVIVAGLLGAYGLAKLTRHYS